MTWSELVPWTRDRLAAPGRALARHEESPFLTLHREMNRLFDEAFGGVEPPAQRDAFQPRLDVSETDAALLVRVEVPGLDPKDIEVSLTDDVLVVRGEKRREETTKDARWHRVETSFGAFERALRLPVEVQAEQVTAAHDKGVLTITLPKAASARGATRRIEVTA